MEANFFHSDVGDVHGVVKSRVHLSKLQLFHVEDSRIIFQMVPRPNDFLETARMPKLVARDLKHPKTGDPHKLDISPSHHRF